jgi:hypothetical protein
VDWRDYADRNAKADPVAIGAALQATAGTSTIWLMFNSGYRTFGTQCEQLDATLGAGRTSETVVPSRAGVFEPAILQRYTFVAP